MEETILYDTAKRFALERAGRENEPTIIYSTWEQRLGDRNQRTYYYVRLLDEDKPLHVKYEEIVLPPKKRE